MRKLLSKIFLYGLVFGFNLLLIVIPIFFIADVQIKFMVNFLQSGQNSFNSIVAILVFIVSLAALCFQAATSAGNKYKNRYHSVGEKLLAVALLFSFGALSVYLRDTFVLNLFNEIQQTIIIGVLVALYFTNGILVLITALMQLSVGILWPRLIEGLILWNRIGRK